MKLNQKVEQSDTMLHGSKGLTECLSKDSQNALVYGKEPHDRRKRPAYAKERENTQQGAYNMQNED